MKGTKRLAVLAMFTAIALTIFVAEAQIPPVVPITGVKLGLARVNGPRSRVHLVQAVAQLETHWKRNLEIDVFIPISTKVPGEKLDWVKGCAVTGLADIKL